MFLSLLGLSYHQVTASYDVSTIAGGGAYPGDGGSPTIAAVSSPAGIFVDSNNTTYIADTNNNRIRMIWGPASNGTYTQGNIYTIAGTGTSGFSGDGGLATSALLNAPRSVKVDSAGNIFVADYNNNRIRKFTLGGNISTIAGGGVGDGGSPTAAAVNSPGQVVLDALNNIYIADTSNHRIRMVWGAASNGTYTQGNMYTIAGTGVAGNAANGVAATSAPLSSPRGVQVDSLGNIYIADYGNSCIRRFTLGGTISTIVGTAGSSGFSGDGGGATSARLSGPTAFFVDALRNVYIADQNNRRIRFVPTVVPAGSTYTAGNIYTIAGTGANGFSGDGGAATSALFGSPAGVCVDSSGRIFVADQTNNRIRMFTLGGNISTVAGGGTSSANGALATSSLVSSPQNVFADPSNNIYIAEFGARIRKFTVGGNISTIAGTGTQGYNGDGIAATSAWIRPFSVYVDSSQNVYVADWTNHRIRKFIEGGTISTIAGTGSTTFIGDGGLATNAGLNAPTNFCLDNTGNIYIADQNNSRIRMLWNSASNGTYAQGRIYTVAGTGSFGFNGDGISATSAAVNSPGGVFVDSSGGIYVADCANSRIRKFTLGGNISTIAGNGTTGYSGDGGSATSAMMNLPQDVFVDSSGRIYVADLFGNNIRMFTEGGNISTIAGNGTATYNGDGIPATSAQLRPFGIYVDNSQNVYVAEWINNNRIRKFPVGGNISTIAGNGSTTYTGDGGPAGVALLNNPGGIIRDSAGNTYFADTSNNRIRRVDASTGIMTTIAGTGSAGYSGDGGLATAAMINAPYGLCLDPSGNVFFSDTNNARIRRVDAVTGMITTIAGGVAASHADGVGTAARFINPGMMSLNSSGNLLIADSDNTIRQVTTAGGVYNVSTLFTYNVGTPPVQTVASYLGNQLLTTDSYSHLYRWVQSGTAYIQNTNLDGVSGPAYAGRGLVVDSNNNIFMTDYYCGVIYKILSTGSYSVFAGVWQGGYSVKGGYQDGTQAGSSTNSTSGSGTLFYGPAGITIDSSDNLYVCDTANNAIRKITPTGVVTTIAGANSGVLNGAGSTDGIGSAARFNQPWDIDIDASGNLYVVDKGNNLIRKLLNGGGTYTVTTLAGTAGAIGSADGVGAAARFSSPSGISVDSSGIVYVSDTTNNTIRRITSDGAVTTVAGAVTFSLSSPSDLDIDTTGNLYIADRGDNTIKKLTNSSGSYVGSTLAGSAGVIGSTDGIGSAARFNAPRGLAIDTAGIIYVLDTNNNAVRKILTDGMVSTISTIANGTAAAFNLPWDIDVDDSGNLYVADRGNNVIKKFTRNDSTYTMSIIAGTAGSAGFVDGTGSAARFSAPTGVMVDASGKVYVTDANNRRIRMLFSNNTYDVAPGSTQTISDTTTQPVVTGGGTAVLPPSNAVTSVEVANGTLQVSSSAPVTFNASTGGSAVVQVTANTNTGAYNFATAGTVQVDSGVVANLNTPPSGTGLMSITGAGSVEATSDLSSSATPIAVSGLLEVSGSNGKLPSAAVSVASGGVLQLGDVGVPVASNAVPGASDFATGSILSVPNGVQVPNNALANPTIHTGVKLRLGDGSRITQGLNVVA